MMYSQIIAWAAGAYAIILALISVIILVKCLKDDKPAGLIILFIGLLICLTVMVFTFIISIPNMSSLNRYASTSVSFFVLVCWTSAVMTTVLD